MTDSPLPAAIHWKHPTGANPARVDVVALGRTCQTYAKNQLRKQRDPENTVDEVWTINRGLRLFACDLAFVLDELDAENRKDPDYGKAIAAFDKPIITTRSSALAPWATLYPAADILDCFQRLTGMSDPYWHNSIPMVVAYAWFIGVKELRLWGCDYQLEDGRVIEDDRACLEHWVGFVRARGMRVGAPVDSTLFNGYRRGDELYVYGLVDQSTAQDFLTLPTSADRRRGPSDRRHDIGPANGSHSIQRRSG